jgi:hypothetical protein
VEATCQRKLIEGAFINFFTALFMAGENLEMEPSIAAVQRRVTQEMNAELMADFTEKDIGTALQQMAALKAPGLDGFNASFYQQNWYTIHKEVCLAILHFFNTGILDPKINTTFIALIPKISSPSSVTDFRLISLYNVIYKLISKVLANRFKEVLPGIISPSKLHLFPGD